MNGCAVLGLEDGSAFWGDAFGARASAGGEVVFNTAMTGYQEIASDASYNGQIVVLTYPLVGNYGTFREAEESRRPWIEALIVRSLLDPEREAVRPLDEYLAEHGIAGLADVDTRSLVRRLRAAGRLRGYLQACSAELSGDAHVAEQAVNAARGLATLDQLPVVAEVVGPNRVIHENTDGPRVAVVDVGVKENQIRMLVQRGASVRLFGPEATSTEILSWRPAGIVISNGPGDPASLGGFCETVRDLLGAALVGATLSILGICLGHQIVGRAIGASTSRLSFGHHGANHPVRDARGGRIFITSQNHEFQVDEASIPVDSGFYVSHRNLIDGSVEGLAHRRARILTVQFHPEGAPGPRDSEWLFDEFVGALRR
jgi:carbamoyl-phosphate synthase small subunit